VRHAAVKQLAGALAALAACGCNATPAQPAPASSSAIVASSSVPRPVGSHPRPPDAADGGLLSRKLPRIEYRGGPFVRHPRVVTISFTNDDAKLVGRFEQFGAMITRSSWWHTVTEGYCAENEDCIGEGVGAAAVHLDKKLPAKVTDRDVEAILLESARSGRFGRVDASSLLVTYLPKGVDLSDATTPKFCGGGPRGYHRAMDLDGVRVPFAILPRCGEEAELTGTASHEILEATTNPFPLERGFAFVSGPDLSGFGEAGLEPVDPCGLTMMDTHWTTESGFVVHRAWSNREAWRAHDPCVPSRPEIPYVMLVPRAGGLRVAKEGDSASLSLDATSDRPISQWAVSAMDLSGYQDHEQYLEVTLDKSTVAPGDSVGLTVTFKKRHPLRRALVAVVSTVGVHSRMWPLYVTMR